MVQNKCLDFKLSLKCKATVQICWLNWCFICLTKHYKTGSLVNVTQEAEQNKLDNKCLSFTGWDQSTEFHRQLYIFAFLYICGYLNTLFLWGFMWLCEFFPEQRIFAGGCGPPGAVFICWQQSSLSCAFDEVFFFLTTNHSLTDDQPFITVNPKQTFWVFSPSC